MQLDWLQLLEKPIRLVGAIFFAKTNCIFWQGTRLTKYLKIAYQVLH